jgi:hypothetical protein
VRRTGGTPFTHTMTTNDSARAKTEKAAHPRQPRMHRAHKRPARKRVPANAATVMDKSRRFSGCRGSRWPALGRRSAADGQARRIVRGNRHFRRGQRCKTSVLKQGIAYADLIDQRARQTTVISVRRLCLAAALI